MKRFLAVLIGTLLPATASASVDITSYGWKCDGLLKCGFHDNVISDLLINLTRNVTYFIGAIAVVSFLYGAIRMVTSQGDEGKEAGKKAMMYASLGLVAAIMTTAIIRFINATIDAIA